MIENNNNKIIFFFFFGLNSTMNVNSTGKKKIK